MMWIHIILVLLKIIGILLLVVVSLLLLAIFSILFVPVRYQAYGYRDNKTSQGIIRGFWLARLISCKVSYDSYGKKIKWSVRIFGISIQKVTAWKKKRKSRRQNTKRKKTQTKRRKEKKTETVLKAKELQENIECEQNQNATEAEQKRKKIKDIEQKPEKVERINQRKIRKEKRANTADINIFQKIKNIRNSPNNSSKRLKNLVNSSWICDKISEIRTFLESEVFLNAKTLLLGEVKKLGLHILPRKVQGEIEFGFDDPSLTGRVLAVAGICYPLYGNNIKVTPYFDRKILEGELKVKGRIRGIVLLKSALKVSFNQEVREIWKNFKG